MEFTLSQYALPLFIALFGLETKSLTMNGAISAVLVSYTILLRQSLIWFLILFSFYIVGTLVTRIGKSKKEESSILQKTRGPWNIIGNAGLATIMALLGGFVGFVGFVAAISTATADTVSSELGVLSKKDPLLVTTLKRVQPGTNGGVTLLGTTLGGISALIIGLISIFKGGGYPIILIAVLAGIIGCFADSFIGAILENRHIIGNSTTNFLATTVGAVSGILIYLLII